MRILEFLRPAPHQKPIENPEVIATNYEYWRYRTFYAMYFGYVFYYFTRKTFTFVMPALVESGFDMASLGLIGSSLSIMYGLSKFLSGVIGDKSNPRYFMATGLVLTGLCNIFFSFSNSLGLFAVFWGLNGWFQGWGWPGCAKLLTHWYAQSERGRWWSLWNTSHNLGGALIPFIIGFLARYYDWRYCMFFPGMFCIFAGAFLINRLRDTPQSLGLPRIEEYKKEKTNPSKEEVELSVKTILFRFVLRNPYIWTLAFSNFFVYIVRTAVNDWSFLFYYQNSSEHSYMIASFCTCAFEMGGLVGSLSAGWLSDKVFLGRRNPVNIFYLLGVFFVSLAMWQFSHVSSLLNTFWMFWIGFFVFGPQMLIGMAAAELSHKKAAATASGFTGCLGYLGAAFAGFPLGKVITFWGWSGYFILLGLCSLLATLFLIPLWRVKNNLEKEAIDALA